MNSSLAISTAPAKLPLEKAAKRAPWDLKGRLKDIEALLGKTGQQADTLEHQVTQGECPVFVWSAKSRD